MRNAEFTLLRSIQ